MLQKAFFKVDVVDRIYDTPVFEKTTPGAYEFTVPEEYNYVVIEYAGAGGGSAKYGQTPTILGGKGSILKITKSKINSFRITGIVGQVGENGGTTIGTAPRVGGTGYKNGEDSPVGPTSIGGLRNVGGAGGGSTSVVFNNNTYEASAGGGAYVSYGGGYAGKGGGQYGGARQTTADATGNNATDPNQIAFNSGDGYVKIWAGYDPYFKG